MSVERDFNGLFPVNAIIAIGMNVLTFDMKGRQRVAGGFLGWKNQTAFITRSSSMLVSTFGGTTGVPRSETKNGVCL